MAFPDQILGQDLDALGFLTVKNIRLAAADYDSVPLIQVLSLIKSNAVSQEAVINIVDNTLPPPTENDGDRYIPDATGAMHPNWDGAASWDILTYELATDTWNKVTPEEGWTTYVDVPNGIAVFRDDPTVGWIVTPLTPTLTNVLAAGNTSGANDAIMSNQQKIRFNEPLNFIHEKAALGNVEYSAAKGHEFVVGTEKLMFDNNGQLSFSQTNTSGAITDAQWGINTNGTLNFTNNDNGFGATMYFPADTFTGYRTYTFPNKDGTVALTNDIAGSANQTEVNAGTEATKWVTADTLEDKTYGTFTGSTITDNVTLKVALQELETAAEATPTLSSVLSSGNSAGANIIDMNGNAIQFFEAFGDIVSIYATDENLILDSDLGSVIVQADAGMRVFNGFIVDGSSPSVANVPGTNVTWKSPNGTGPGWSGTTGTINGYITAIQPTANRVYTIKDESGTFAFLSDITGTNSGTNTGDEVQATTTVLGIAELATQAEVNTGTDTLRIVTPDTLEDKTYGTFTGTTITDNSTLKTALQELETAVESAGGGGIDQKAGSISSGWSGNPKKATVTLTTAFASANYTPVVSFQGADNFVYTVESIAAGSFVINTNQNTTPANPVLWEAHIHSNP